MKTCPKCKNELIKTLSAKNTLILLCPNSGKGCYHAEKI